MNPRERQLLIGVGCTVAVLLVGFYFYKVWGLYSVQRAQIEKFEGELEVQQRRISLGGQAAKTVRAYEARALPPDPAKATSLYHEFLLDLADRQAGLHDVGVNVTAGSVKKGVYHRLVFNVSADGSLEKLCKFLHLFYSVDYLHRVQSLIVQPLEKSKDLRISLVVDVLSLPGAPARDRLESGPAKRLALPNYEDYVKTIVERNVFAPPNQPPKIAALSTQKATTKKPFTLTLQADEADWLDILKFEIVGQPPKGVSLKAGELGKIGEPQTAQFSWTPPEKGEYTFDLLVKDDGVPSRFDRKTFKIVVADPPPPPIARAKPPPLPAKPKFDVAKYTYLTSIVERDGEPGIWLIERTTGKRLELTEGDKFDVGSMQGKVVKIGSQDIEIEVGGKRLFVSLGSTLSEAFSLDL